MKVSVAPLLMHIVTTRGGGQPNHRDKIKLKRSINLKWPIIDKLYWKALVFEHSLGSGEAKIAQCIPDKYNLCHDLLHLALFCKETIDKNQLNASLAFQINGFSLSFPRSLEELASFVSLKNLNTLMRISEMFWRTCKPVSAQDVDT
ncbi:hypothetical protein HMPREF1544_01000 [Mucor circinelloides 1006PhL]|uniref:Uncharacterized protein n=1 Tax=Mucor circinelloides f. circinelloides (strain 1006PhL) TaxID=1220926 RepID=S2KIC4_MUCC1|nr:hypothetical protein HMPREF1544_01000 [Mucor circinelloides 1006PhL]